MYAHVDRKRCTGCGACVEVCPVHAVRLVDGVAEIDAARCTACEACADVCPQRAITTVSAPVTRQSDVVPVASPPARQAVAVPAVRPARQVRPWVGAALAFVAREIVPRLATSLLDIWDRRHASVTSVEGWSAERLPTRQGMATGERAGGGPHQHRWQHGRR